MPTDHRCSRRWRSATRSPPLPASSVHLPRAGRVMRVARTGPPRRREHVRADPRDHGRHDRGLGRRASATAPRAGAASPVVLRATSIARVTTATSQCRAPPIHRWRVSSRLMGRTSPEDRARFGRAADRARSADDLDDLVVRLDRRARPFRRGRRAPRGTCGREPGERRRRPAHGSARRGAGEPRSRARPSGRAVAAPRGVGPAPCAAPGARAGRRPRRGPRGVAQSALIDARGTRPSTSVKP